MTALKETPTSATVLALTPGPEVVGGLPGLLPAQVIELRPTGPVPRAGPRAPKTGEPFEVLVRLAVAGLDAALAFVGILDQNPLFGANHVEIGDGTDRGGFAQRSFCRKVIASREELVIEDARRVADRDVDCFTEAEGLVAWAGLPIRDGSGEIVGALCVADRRPRSWSGRELDLVRELAGAAAHELALHADLDFSRRHAEERAALARTLQESLLPPWLPQIPGMQVAARYVAGGSGVDVLGDFYDVFPSVRGNWGVVVGDVCGKGVPAAKSTALARYTLRAEAHRESRPSLILAVLNQALLDWPTDDPRFLTAIYATVRPTPAGASVQISSAGHPLALVRRADGRVRRIGRPGTLLGHFDDPVLSDSRSKLQSGDSLVLFTDGVTEARRPGRRELFGESRLRAVLAKSGDLAAAQIADAVQQAVRAFGGRPASDDTVVLVLKATPGRASTAGVGTDAYADADAGSPPSRWSARNRAHIAIPATRRDATVDSTEFSEILP